MLLHNEPWHSLHDAVQFNPAFRQVHRLLSQDPLQPHRIICSKSCGPASSSIIIGMNNCSFICQPQSKGMQRFGGVGGSAFIKDDKIEASSLRTESAR